MTGRNFCLNAYIYIGNKTLFGIKLGLGRINDRCLICQLYYPFRCCCLLFWVNKKKKKKREESGLDSDYKIPNDWCWGFDKTAVVQAFRGGVMYALPSTRCRLTLSLSFACWIYIYIYATRFIQFGGRCEIQFRLPLIPQAEKAAKRSSADHLDERDMKNVLMRVREVRGWAFCGWLWREFRLNTPKVKETRFLNNVFWIPPKNKNCWNSNIVLFPYLSTIWDGEQSTFQHINRRSRSQRHAYIYIYIQGRT